MDKQHTGNLRFLPGCPIRSLQHCSLLLAGSENTNLSRLRCREKGSLGYFDTYFTPGPFFTKGFKALAKKYKDFEVVETGWPRQDWIYENLHTFDAEKNALLRKHQKSKLALYAPTFSPSLTSLPFIKKGLEKLAREKDVLLILKFHPLTRSEWMEEYRQLA